MFCELFRNLAKSAEIHFLFFFATAVIFFCMKKKYLNLNRKTRQPFCQLDSPCMKAGLRPCLSTWKIVIFFLQIFREIKLKYVQLQILEFIIEWQIGWVGYPKPGHYVQFSRFYWHLKFWTEKLFCFFIWFWWNLVKL